MFDPLRRALATRAVRLARGQRLALSLFVLGAAGLGLAGPAKAAIISISAMGFSMHCPCTVDPADDSTDNNGTLQAQDQFVRPSAAVPFPTDGQRVCSMSLVYRDVNANDAIRARLLRKTFASGGNAFAAPTMNLAFPGVQIDIRPSC